MASLLWLLPAAILFAAAATKVADPRPATLAGYGIPARARTPLWAALVAVEGGLAAAIAAGSATAAQLAGGLLALFLIAQLAALARGGEGAPCGCFGRSETLSRRSAGRTAVLAIACAALPAIGAGPDLPPALTAAITAALLAAVAAYARRATWQWAGDRG